MLVSTTFEHQLAEFKSKLINNKWGAALDSFYLAQDYHNGTRKDGVTPEFHHQLSIAQYLYTLPLKDKENCIIAANLHDLEEDYNYPRHKIREKYGDLIADAVGLLNKYDGEDRKSKTRYYRELSENCIAGVVKGADRIHNVQTMAIWNIEKQRKYGVEVGRFILPMLEKVAHVFPDYENACTNIGYVLIGQLELIERMLKQKEETIKQEQLSCSLKKWCPSANGSLLFGNVFR
jgi:(p)ppGpp synthase/HD superfamily hydrolase